MATRTWVRSLLAVVVAGVCFGVAIPAIAGVPWSGILAVLVGVPLVALLLLTAVWMVGLLLHTVTLTAALPGLTARRALTLSLTGSSIANVLPLGGAAGIALNYSMARSWGFSRPAFTAYTVVSNLWIVLAKLLLPELALTALVLSPVPGVGSFRTAALVAAAALAGTLTVVLWVGTRSSRLRREGSVLPACRTVIRSAWHWLSLGTAGYFATLGLLLWLCLHLTGLTLPLTGLLVCLAVERLSTLANLTPGGLGVVEVGLVGVLVAMGGAPAAVVAGVLLYRAFTFGLEIPVGGLWLAGWWGLRRLRLPAAAVA